MLLHARNERQNVRCNMGCSNFPASPLNIRRLIIARLERPDAVFVFLVAAPILFTVIVLSVEIQGCKA